MPYYAQKHAGPWAEHAIIPDAEFEAHPFKDKFLRNGSVVQMSDAAARDMQNPEVDATRLADIDAQINQLHAERAKVLGQAVEPNAPAAVTYDLDRTDQPTAQEADAHRAAGAEVIQPTAGDVVVGTVEAAEGDKPKGRK